MTGPIVNPEATDYVDDDWDEEDRTCPNCGGDGGEPFDDYCTPCEECDGEGYKWWL